MNDKDILSNYLSNLLPVSQDWVADLESQAKRDDVPILDAVSMQFIMQLIRLNRPQRILEIGTAIGYSALRMLEAHPESVITTIEKDANRYQAARSNFKKYTSNQNIEIIHGDAADVLRDLVHQGQRFDCVLIDAAKGQYQNYFKLADSLLVNGGFIIADNVLFRGYVTDEQTVHPRYSTMVKRLKTFNHWISNHPTYHTSIVPIGDGISISYKCIEGEL